MTELDILIDSPIGALFIVGSSISVFAILAILVLRKGTGLHSMLGYFYLFGIGFSNYAAIMSNYEGMLPATTIIVSAPFSSLFLVLGIVFIIPKEKSALRIKAHVISMMISSVAFGFGVITQWYHFNVSLLHILRWPDVRSVMILSMPLFVIGLITTLHFMFNRQDKYLKVSSRVKDIKEEISKTIREEITSVPVSSRTNSEIIYQEEAKKTESQLPQGS